MGVLPDAGRGGRGVEWRSISTPNNCTSVQVEDFKLAPIIVELERVFQHRNMRGHAEKLARFKAGYEAQRERLARLRDKPWTSETVLELAAVYQVAPFAERYPVAPNDGRCTSCRADIAGRDAAPVCAKFADRTLYECRKCARRFVRLKG
jgi:hypothetical protein